MLCICSDILKYDILTIYIVQCLKVRLINLCSKRNLVQHGSVSFSREKQKTIKVLAIAFTKNVLKAFRVNFCKLSFEVISIILRAMVSCISRTRDF